MTVNPVFDEKAFEIEFPVGTVVTDGRPHANPDSLGLQVYIVTENGGKRMITWDESSATYEELLASPSGMAGKIPKRNEPLIIINIFIVIVLAGLIVRKRYRARASL
jgi:hypothetical protein